MTPVSHARVLPALLVAAALSGCDDRTETTAPSPAAELAPQAVRGVAREDNRPLAELRQVTARFHNIAAARRAGYVEQVTPCWAHHSEGAMGYHYGRLELFDAVADLLEPELLMYEPQAGGHERLVGMEYVVPLAAWEEAGHDLSDPEDVPELLGQEFTRHSFLPIFKLHIWLWRQNPAGVFADWNPKVSCEHAEETEVF